MCLSGPMLPFSFILGSTDTIIRFDAISSVPSTSKKRDKWPTSFHTQFKMLTWRNFKQSKGRILHLYDVIKYIVVSAIIGTLYYQIQQNEDTVRDRVGLVTMIFYNNSFFASGDFYHLLITFANNFNPDQASRL